VTSAKLKVYQAGVFGTPYTDLATLLVSHMLADYVPLDATDYVAPNYLSWMGTIINSAALGTYEFDVTDRVESDRLAAKPRTQYRLFFMITTDNDNTEDSMGIRTSEYGGTDRPRLEIQY
jgi:hypothetical protein